MKDEFLINFNFRRVYPHHALPQRISLPVQQSRSVATPGSHHGAPSVVGKERVKFYSRPVLPGNQSLVPVIKYAPDVSRAGAGDDFTAEFLARRDSYDTVRRSVSNVASVSVQVWGGEGGHRAESSSLQTVYREMETQTEPFDPDLKEVSTIRDPEFPEFDTEYRPDVLALASLKTGSGLPVETQFDVDRVKSLVRLQREEDRLERLEAGGMF